MNATRDPETIMTAWLDEGPTDLPDVTRRAILTALPTTQQRGLGPLALLRHSPMLIYPRLTAAVLVTIIAVGGAMYMLGQRNSVGPPVPTASPAAPSATPSPVAAASAAATHAPIDTSLWIPFTSAYYGFSVSHPGAWSEQPASGRWALAKQDDADVDIFWSPGGWPQFSAFETKLPAGTTADKFLQDFTADAVIHACYPPPSGWVQTTVDGHPASIAYAGCNEHFYFAQATVVIGKRVWFFILTGPDRSLIVPFLSTVHIDPTAAVD